MFIQFWVLFTTVRVWQGGIVWVMLCYPQGWVSGLLSLQALQFNQPWLAVWWHVCTTLCVCVCVTAGTCLKDFWHVLVPAFFTLDWKHMLLHNRHSVSLTWREGPRQLPPHLAELAPLPGESCPMGGWLYYGPRPLSAQASGSVWICLAVTSISTCFSNFQLRLSCPQPLTAPGWHPPPPQQTHTSTL